MPSARNPSRSRHCIKAQSERRAASAARLFLCCSCHNKASHHLTQETSHENSTFGFQIPSRRLDDSRAFSDNAGRFGGSVPYSISAWTASRPRPQPPARHPRPGAVCLFGPCRPARPGQNHRPGPTRGVVTYPSGQQDGSTGGVVFDTRVNETGRYHLRVTESSMGTAWRGRVIVDVTRR